MENKAFKYIVPGLLLSMAAQNTFAAGWAEKLTNMMGGYNTSSYPSANQYNLTEDQARDYLAQILASFQYAFDIKQSSFGRMNRFIVGKIVGDSGTYTHTTAGRRYDKSALDQRINSAMLLYIEKKAYEYAYSRTKNSAVAKRVSESMRNNALAVMQKSRYFNAEDIAPFVGRALRRAVRDYVNRLDAPHQSYNQSYSQPVHVPAPRPTTPRPANYYPSEECIVCYEDLVKNVNQVFLYPCGHDLCVNCARQWFNSHQKSCPKCRGNIDFDLLKATISSME